MCNPRECGLRGHRVHDRAVQAELHEHRRPQLADEAAHVAQLAAEQLAQEAELGAGHRRVALEHAVDELDLEDRVRQRLGRPVVDLLGEPGALGLLGLDDPHPELGRDGRRSSRRRARCRRAPGTATCSRCCGSRARGAKAPSRGGEVAARVRSASPRSIRSRRSAAPASARRGRRLVRRASVAVLPRRRRSRRTRRGRRGARPSGASSSRYAER